MKKFLKVFSLLMVVTLALGFSGCGKEDPVDEPSGTDPVTPVETQLTEEQILTLFTQMMDIENPNFTLTMDANYAISMTPTGEAMQSQSDSITGAVMKVNSTGSYEMMPNDTESYSVGNYYIDRDLEQESPGYQIEYYQEHNEEDSTEIIAYVNDILQETFTNMLTFDPTWVSTEHLDSGAYSLSIGTNLKEEIAAIATAIVTYGDQPLGTLIDAILAVHYNDLTIQSLVTDLKTEITSTSTVADVISFAGDKLGISLDDTFASILAILDEDEILNANFYELLEVENATEFATMIDQLVANYLTNTELTLDGFINSLSAEDDENIAMLQQIYASLDELQVADFSFDITFTTDTQNQNLASATATVSADLTIMGVRYTISANASLALSNINSTVITLPTMTDIEDIYVRLEFETSELTANTEKVVSDINLGEQDFVIAQSGNTTANATYSASNRTLTLSADAVDIALSNGNFYAWDSETGYEISANIYSVMEL